MIGPDGLNRQLCFVAEGDVALGKSCDLFLGRNVGMDSQRIGRGWLVATVTIVSLGLGSATWAQNSDAKKAKVQPTTLTTKAMCQGCVKKVVTQAQKLGGIADVRADIASKTLMFVPNPGNALSPRLLWEVVEKSGEQPVRLAGPGGVFTKKPQPAITITTKTLCPKCAGSIVGRVRQIKGVADAGADVKSKTFTFVPKPGSKLSPRALWEVVQKGGEQPVRLAGPTGVFTKKPRS